MTLKSNECHCMCLGKDTEKAKFHFDGNSFVNSKEGKILKY